MPLQVAAAEEVAAVVPAPAAHVPALRRRRTVKTFIHPRLARPKQSNGRVGHRRGTLESTYCLLELEVTTKQFPTAVCAGKCIYARREPVSRLIQVRAPAELDHPGPIFL